MTHEKITHIDLFSGIGGFALAADRVWSQGGVEHIFCDNEPFAQEILKKHWPEAPILGDIRSFTNTRSEKPRGLSSSEREALASARESGVFILTGGFPCQPFSQAGRRRGEEDDRFLWPEMLRVIREFSPLWVIAENVRGLLTQGGGVVFERVCTDLEAAGYEVQPLIIPAVAVGAPHRRDRVWFVAHRRQQHGSERRDEGMDSSSPIGASRKSHTERRGEDDTNPNSERLQGSTEARNIGESRETAEQRFGKLISWDEPWIKIATEFCGIHDGVRNRMDRNPRLKALGNAIVPQVAEEIMRAIHATTEEYPEPPYGQGDEEDVELTGVEGAIRKS